MEDLLKDLNLEQKKAVTHGRGPLLIIAGAGCGKTAVITRRIGWLIKQKKAKPAEILALTFTEKAAAEMEERVDILVPYGYIDTQISTFHAFGDRVLREYPLEAGLTADFKVLSDAEQLIFLKENLFKFSLKYFLPLSDPTKYLPAISKFISRLKDEDITSEDLQKFINGERKTAKDEAEINEITRLEELAKFYAIYQGALRDIDAIDFGDQIILVLKLWRQFPKILKNYQKQFKYILVDEFQDTNFAQNELLKLLSGPAGNITVVGDDDQAIYRFRGAAVSNILDFRKNFKKVKTVVLTQNYRSGREILDAAYRLIQFNNPDRLEVKEKISKKLLSQPDQPAQIEFFLAAAGAAETQRIAQKIKELTNIKFCQFKDIAILVRANQYAQNFFAAFNNHNIPYQFSGGSGLFAQREIRTLVSFLKTLTNWEDSIAFYDLAIEVFKLSPDELAETLSFARRRNRGLRQIFEGPQNYPDRPKLKSITQTKIDKMIEFLTDFGKLNQKQNVGELLYGFLQKSKILPNLIKKAETDTLAAAAVQNIAQFWQKVQEFLKISQNPRAEHLIDNLDSLIEAGDNPKTAELDPDLDAVNILTVHAAKGLEFKVVFLAVLAADRFPARRRGESLELPEKLIKETLPTGDYHLQEERRLFYVAMTRAKELLFLSAAKIYEGLRTPKKISPFVFEVLGKVEIKTPTAQPKIAEIMTLFDFNQLSIQSTKRFFKNNRVSLSVRQIDDYLTCPKKFEYLHILEVPVMADPRVNYGSAIHKAIEFYFRATMHNRRASPNEVIGVFEKNWLSEGFISYQHEQLRRRQGQETLLKFIQKMAKEKFKPAKVEESFKFNLENAIIRGRFDIVLKERDKTTILDFKTSELADQKDALRRVKQANQMRIYALAWQTLFGVIPETALYFIESDLIGQHQFSKKELQNTQDKISAAVAGLKKTDFSATPGPHQCKWCAYQGICPYRFK